MYFLFLDDFRQFENVRYPEKVYNDCLAVITAKSLEEFKKVIIDNGLPKYVSFDIDLHPNHYVEWAKRDFLFFDPLTFDDTGYNCALFLIDYCSKKNIDLPIYFIHSMNTAGRQHLQELLNKYTLNRK